MSFGLPLEISVREAQQLLADEAASAKLLDCREHAEYALVRLEGATLIPVGEIALRLNELGPLRDQRVIVYCHHGGRSLMVTEFLRQQGFRHAQNMRGGIDAWSRMIDPSIPRY